MVKKQILKSDVFNYSSALERQYRIEIKGMVDKMLKDVADNIVKSYRKNKDGFTFATDGAFSNVDDELKELEKKYREIFARQGEVVAKRMVMRQLKYNRSSFKKIMKKLMPNDEEIPSLAGSVIPRDMEQVIKASIMENVSLIRSIESKYFEQITGAVARSMQAGGSIKQLKQEILHYNGMTRRRADIIANDQSRKAYMSINLRNMAKAGIQKVEWVHSGGGYTVREYHYRKWDGVSGRDDGHPNGLNGFIFDIDKPPVIQEAKGKQQEIRGYPAQLPNCYHKDTEVYTERGFVPIKDVYIGEKVLTLNPYTKQPEWSVCNGTVSKYVERIAHLKGQRFSLKTDINHRFFMYRPYYGNGKRIISMKPDFIDGVYNISKRGYFYGSTEWKGTETEYVDIGNLHIPIDDYLRFMGYYLSEGSIDNRDTMARVQIAQKTYLDKMFENLTFFNPHKVKNGINIYNSGLRTYLKQFGKAPDKYVPNIIKSLPKEKIRIFLDAFALGDGTLTKVRNSNLFKGKVYNCYSTSSKRLADDLIELIIKTGMGVSCITQRNKGKICKFRNGFYKLNTDIYAIQEKVGTNYQVKSLRVIEENYNDIVYDISVEDNHTLLIKYGSSIAWNSNCKCVMRAIVEIDPV